jgi:hypothetical protein
MSNCVFFFFDAGLHPRHLSLIVGQHILEYIALLGCIFRNKSNVGNFNGSSFANFSQPSNNITSLFRGPVD